MTKQESVCSRRKISFIALPLPFSDRKGNCTVRPAFSKSGNNGTHFFISKCHVFAALKYKGTKSKLISDLRALHYLFFCKPVSVTIFIRSPNAAV